MAHQLESIEWVQYWAENCTIPGPRVLMIGDSISVGYRSAVFARIREKYGAATVSTSKALDNPHFTAEIDALASSEGFEYRVIHFNNGLHGFQLSGDEYRTHYEETVRFLRDRWPDARLILAASTPVTENGRPDVLAPINEKVLERNRIAHRIAEKNGLEYNDLYALVEGDPSLRSPDGYHYNGAGYEKMADRIAALMLKD